MTKLDGRAVETTNMTVKCTYPNCDGGPAAGYWHSVCRIVLCEACGGEGRILTSDGGPDDTDHGPCPWCEGTGGEIIQTQAIELDDLDECAPPMGAFSGG